MASGRDFQLSDSYGAPQAPPYDSGYPSFNNPGYDSNYPDYGSPQRNPQSPTYNNNPYYVGYTSDLELSMKLGQVALIAFIILAIFVLVFLLFKCFLECRKMGNKQPNFPPITAKRTLNQR